MTQFVDTEAYRDSIATVDAEGKRVWLRPEQPKGWFYDQRKLLSYLLLLVLFGLPFIEFGSKPLFLFDVLGREFRLFGIPYGPQDFYLAGLAMVTIVVGIALFTVAFGRLFCGWICPQTIFMEMVYRRVEYAIEGSAAQQRRLDKAPWTWNKVWRRGLKHAVFFGIAVLIANTFLSYVIGWREVYQIATEPVTAHLGGFAAMVGFSAVFYGVFSRLREQVCTSICPYGRLQSVLVDADSIGVAYDEVRGEPRGKVKKKRKLSPKPKAPSTTTANSIVALSSGATLPAETSAPVPAEPGLVFAKAEPQGDCVDCGLCVRVCPTGIDIRDGMNQLECVHCTACIDACDGIMDKLNRPKGLIRHDSAKGLASGKRQRFTKRAAAYLAVFVALLGVNATLLVSRAPLRATVMRTPGMLYQEVDEATLSNLYNYQFFNRTADTLAIRLVPAGLEGLSVRFVGKAPRIAPDTEARGSFFLEAPKASITQRSTELSVEVEDENTGQSLEGFSTRFLAPETD